MFGHGWRLDLGNHGEMWTPGTGHDRLAGHCGGKGDHGKNRNFCLSLDQEFVDLRESLLHVLARGHEPDPTLIVLDPGYGDLPHLQWFGTIGQYQPHREAPATEQCEVLLLNGASSGRKIDRGSLEYYEGPTIVRRLRRNSYCGA
jgi:hypothetical protein